MAKIDVNVPDIGDFKDVPIIEVFVKPGDQVKVEDPLDTLESDKATMDVPSTSAGVIKEVKVKLGDKVSEGTVIAVVEAAGAAAKPIPTAAAAPAPPSVPPAPKAASAAPQSAPVAGAATFSGKADVECEMLVLGSGPGGYSAAFRSADLGM